MIIVAGPPYSGVELVARELGLPVLDDEDIRDMATLNRVLVGNGDSVIATTRLAHIVHEFSDHLIKYVLRDPGDIEREMQLAEYPAEDHIRRILEDIEGRDRYIKEAFNRVVDPTKSLPDILYDWWDWQKTEISFLMGHYEEVRASFTGIVESL